MNEGGKVFEIDLKTPLGTSGVFRSPIVGDEMLVDGKETPSNGDHIQLSGGKHTIQVLEK